MIDSKMNWGLVYQKDGKYLRLEVPTSVHYDQLPHFTLDNLMDGLPFFYNGHFSRLRECEMPQAGGGGAMGLIELRFNEVTGILEASDGIQWTLRAATDGKFVVYRPEYGNIYISFKECQLKQ